MGINSMCILRAFSFVLIFLSSIALGDANKQLCLADVQTKEYVNGKVIYGINLKALNYFLARISQHVFNYPPTFKDKKEEAFIRSQLKSLLDMQKKAYVNIKNDINLVGRYAYTLSMAYNLDMLRSRSEVTSVFEQALSINQNSSKVNYLYGIFLYQSGSPDNAVPHLEKAIKESLISHKERLD